MGVSSLDRIVARSAFPAVLDAYREQAKINSVRIAVGAVMFYRTALIVAATYYYHPTDVAAGQITAKFLLGCGMLGLLGAYTVGFLTPIVGLALILTYPYFDLRLLTGTLGTNVASICLVALLLLNAGSRYSVDALLLRRCGFGGRLWRALYSVIGHPDARQTARIYFLAFLAYALISLAALGHHVADSYWREGRTVGVMLTSAFLSRHYDFFRTWEAAAPQLYWAFSSLSVVGQSVFQALMVPFMFSTWGRRFVVAWGAAFFAISIACMQLSYLPYLELALWGLLFVRARNRSTVEATVPIGQRRWMQSTCSAAAFGAFALFLAVSFGSVTGAFPESRWEQPRRALAWVGLNAPQVFNNTDLRSGECWYVICRLDTAGNETLVPQLGLNGERLAYHRNDLLYGGNSLRWRRRMVGNEVGTYNAAGETGYEQIKQVCYYDFARMSDPSIVKYEVRIFRDQSSQPDVPSANRYERREVLAFDVTMDSDAVLSGD